MTSNESDSYTRSSFDSPATIDLIMMEYASQETTEGPDAQFQNATAMIIVLVGPDEVEFTVDRFALRDCAFWDARLSGKWNGGSTIVKLADEDPAIFAEYLKFLNPRSSVLELPDYGEEYKQRCKTLILTYVLAEFLFDFRTANAVMDEYIRVHMELRGHETWDPIHPSPHEVSLVFEHCLDTSEMYKYVVDAAARSRTSGTCDYYKDKVPMEFFFAVAKAMLTLIDFTDEHDTVHAIFDFKWHVQSQGCAYHVHDDDSNAPLEECLEARHGNDADDTDLHVDLAVLDIAGEDPAENW